MTNSLWLLLGFGVLLLVVFAIRRLGLAPAATARQLLGAGALVLDVRSSDEFAAGHVEGAVNLPVEQVRRRIEEIEADRSRPLLAYCGSGARSVVACRILRGLGYRQVHNLGSLGRARAIARR